MHDANDLVRAMQQVSDGASQAGYPADVMSGTVISVKPLKIQVEQRFIINSGQLIIPERLTDHKVKVKLTEHTEKAGEPEHEHKYGGDITVTVSGGLKNGDEVILIRKQGGQKYFVSDKVG